MHAYAYIFIKNFNNGKNFKKMDNTTTTLDSTRSSTANGSSFSLGSSRSLTGRRRNTKEYYSSLILFRQAVVNWLDNEERRTGQRNVSAAARHFNIKNRAKIFIDTR